MEGLPINNFKSVGNVELNQKLYDVFLPKYQGMCLIGKDGFPIVSLHLETIGFDDCNSIICKRSNIKDGFQGILDKNKQKFGFNLQNLTNDKILFAIRKNRPDGPKVNTIDIIPANSIERVFSDNSNEDRELMLEFLNEKSDKSLKEFEKSEKDHESLGAYYFLNIVPSTNSGLDLSGARWICPDVLIRKKEEFIRRGGYGGWRREGNFWGSSGPRPSFTNPQPQPAWGISDPRPDFSNLQLQPAFFGSGCSWKSSGPRANGGFSCSATTDEYDLEFANYEEEEDVVSPSFSPIEKPPQYEDIARPAKQTFGKHIQLKTRRVQYSFEYKKASPPERLVLSILPPQQKIILREPMAPEQAFFRGMQLLQDILLNEKKALLEQIEKVYTANECVICLEDTPDSIIVQCGHKCLHQKCVPKGGLGNCPVCRGRISAVILN